MSFWTSRTRNCELGLRNFGCGGSISMLLEVMLMGTLVYGIRYTFPEYLCTLLVAGGVCSFALLKTSSKTISKLARPNAPLGYALCFLNLAFDGFTNATQDSISARNKGSSYYSASRLVFQHSSSPPGMKWIYGLRLPSSWMGDLY